ncbi:MAG: hypothetical protein I4N51_08015 [Acinetobacter sp.]|jgi:hypothetical protein|nr:hypothetical protein [Acinetobacter sp.]
MGLVEINFNCWNAKNVRDGLYLYNNLSCKLEMMLMKINAIKTKQDFLTFLDNLKQDHLENIQQWENKDLQSFLAAMHNWMEDMEGFYANTQQPQPEHIPWKIFADILMAGKIYE